MSFDSGHHTRCSQNTFRAKLISHRKTKSRKNEKLKKRSHKFRRRRIPSQIQHSELSAPCADINPVRQDKVRPNKTIANKLGLRRYGLTRLGSTGIKILIERHRRVYFAPGWSNAMNIKNPRTSISSPGANEVR